MARKNRVSVYDGIYHVTARIANRAMLLAEDAVKNQILEWIISVAAFSGVEIWSFAIMDNHLHLFVHVPPVPERYWLNSDEEPCAYAFGMRPPECREPLWSPGGDCPPVPRPSLGFMLDDGEMLGRLVHLYGPSRAEAKERTWKMLRNHGHGHLVDEEKERYCRRMYELMLGCSWEEVRMKLESAYADKLPDSLTPEALKEMLDDYDDEDENPDSDGGVYRASQAIRATMKLFSGAFIGRDKMFVRRAVAGLPACFPRAGTRSVRRCRAFRWELPEPFRSVA